MKYGSFEITSEMHRGPRASVHVARREGSSDDRYAVKVVEPNVSIIGQRAAEQRCEAFLESMRVQQIAASGNSTHWVKVHEMGRVEAAAYVAMDRYRSSVEELVTFRRDPDASELYEIIRGVVAGLVELDEKYKSLSRKLDEDEAGTAPRPDRDEDDLPPQGRCHGNLKAANVLLGDSNTIVALADPASDRQVAENQLTIRDDLRAVGNLIYSLVLHREWRGGFGAKVESGVQWKKLGRTGDGWYRLCSGLVEGDGGAHDADAPKSLEALTAAVAALSPTLKTNSRRPMMLLGGAVAVTLVIGVGLMSVLSGGEPDEQAVVDGDTPPVITPDVPVEPIDDPDEPVEPPSEFASPLQRAWFVSLEQDRATVTSLAPLRALAERREVNDQQIITAVVAASDEANALWSRFEDNGWRGVRESFPLAGAELESFLRDEETLNEQALLDQLKRAAEVVSFLDLEVQREWNVFNEALERMSVAGDDVALSQFESTARQRVASVTTLRALRQTIRDHNRMARELGATVEANWARIDHEYFRAQSGLYPPPSVPDLAYYEQWMNAATSGEYGRIDQQPTLPDFAVVRNDLNVVMQQIGQACGSEPNRQHVDQLQELQRSLENLPWDGSRDAARRFDQAIDEYQRQVSTVRTHFNTQLEVCRNCMAELQRQVEQDPDVTGSIRAYWQQSKQVIASADIQCNERVQRVQALRASLLALEEELVIPLAGRWSDPQMRAAAAQRRDAIAGAAVDSIDPLQNDFTAVLWSEAQTALNQWIAAADTWLDEHDALAAQLVTLPRYAELQARHVRWQEQAEAFESFDQLVQSTRQRIALLHDVESRVLPADGRREMLALLDGADHAEVRMAAWWRLGEVMSDADALQSEQRVWETVEAILAQVDSDRRELLRAEMLQERSRRWERHAAALDSPQAIIAAIELRNEFGIDVSDLDAWLQFNVHLHEYFNATQAADEQRLCGQSDVLLARINELWPEDATRPQRVEAMRQRLVAMERACSGEGTDFAEIGPGALGWFGTVEEEGRLLRFDPPENVDALADHAPLYFRRIDMADGRLVFLCTTEVSLGLFKYAMEAQPQRLREWMPNSMRGAQGWQVQQDRIVLRDRWLGELSPNAGFTCVGELNPPTLNDPAHQVTLSGAVYVASMLGTRLPTLDEWRAALAQGYPGGNVPAGAANRRGLEWMTPLLQQIQASPRHEWWVADGDENFLRRSEPMSSQRDFEAGNPFGDVFLRETSPRGQFGFTSSDGVLWFRDVHGDSASGDNSFRDLVGNVAEFVLSDATPFQSLPATDSLTSEQVQQAFGADVQVYVVGASALSDPAIPYDEPAVHDVRRQRLRWGYGFSDVGFRLVLELQPGQEPTASPTTIVDRLRANPPYIVASDL